MANKFNDEIFCLTILRIVGSIEVSFSVYKEEETRLYDEQAEWTTSGDRGSGNPTLLRQS